MRLVPVSTMVWQLGLQRLSWSPTLILYKETELHLFASKTNRMEQKVCQQALLPQLIHSASPVNLDLPVGLSRDVDVMQFSGVVLRVNAP